jgi:hypothetical protein
MPKLKQLLTWDTSKTSQELAMAVVPAEIVTLDYYDLGRSLLVGTDIAAQLHAENFKGLV